MLDWRASLIRLELEEQSKLAKRIDELEALIAKQSDEFREHIPAGILRDHYDREVGKIQGRYGFAKSLIGNAVDLVILIQKLQTPVYWFDPDVHRTLRRDIAIAKAAYIWELGTFDQKKDLLIKIEHNVAEAYAAAKKSIQGQWEEAKRAGKEEELVARWETRVFLEVGTLLVTAGELKTAGLVGDELLSTAERGHTLPPSEEALLAARQSGESAIRAHTERCSLTGNLARLSPAEISTGERFAAQERIQLRVGTHIGEEFVDGAGKTYDAMGQPNAYKFWNPEQFFGSIVDHLNKTNDYTIIDFNGATAKQIEQIKTYVDGLAKAQQNKIRYLR